MRIVDTDHLYNYDTHFFCSIFLFLLDFVVVVVVAILRFTKQIDSMWYAIYEKSRIKWDRERVRNVQVYSLKVVHPHVANPMSVRIGCWLCCCCLSIFCLIYKLFPVSIIIYYQKQKRSLFAYFQMHVYHKDINLFFLFFFFSFSFHSTLYKALFTFLLWFVLLFCYSYVNLK